MKTCVYMKLRMNPPTLKVVDNAREVVIDLVSVMCDNPKEITLKKDANGDFKMFTHRDAFSNFQFKNTRSEIEWEADAGNWNKVFRMINQGVVQIKGIRSR